jgi:Uncharacterized conserved protein
MLFLIAMLVAGVAPQSSGQKKSKLPTPPNCVHLYGSIFIDRTEISNINWLEYLYFTKLDSSDAAYKKILPDTAVWNDYDTTGSKTKNYLRYPGLRHYPVVGISYEQAVDYCRWRTAVVNKSMAAESKVKFIFRLPKKEEWEYAAGGGISPDKFPFGYSNPYTKTKYNLNKDYRYYFKFIQDTILIDRKTFKAAFENYRNQGQEIIFNVLKDFPYRLRYGALQPLSVINKSNRKSLDPKHRYDFNPLMYTNGLGVSDMIGNVAEMISEKGFAKGGSWAHDLSASEIQKTQRYTKPEAWLGFRCVCEVLASKP